MDLYLYGKKLKGLVIVDHRAYICWLQLDEEAKWIGKIRNERLNGLGKSGMRG